MPRCATDGRTKREFRAPQRGRSVKGALSPRISISGKGLRALPLRLVGFLRLEAEERPPDPESEMLVVIHVSPFKAGNPGCQRPIWGTSKISGVSVPSGIDADSGLRTIPESFRIRISQRWNQATIL